jgi:hypothetical protein
MKHHQTLHTASCVADRGTELKEVKLEVAHLKKTIEWKDQDPDLDEDYYDIHLASRLRETTKRLLYLEGLTL